MKLLTFEVATPVGRFQRLGALLDTPDYILDLNAAYRWWHVDRGVSMAHERADLTVPSSMTSFIQGGDISLEEASKILTKANAEWNCTEAARFKGDNGEQLMFHTSAVKVRCPLPRPNSLRDFITFEAHIKRGYEIRNAPFPEEWYKRPVYYKGNRCTVMGPNDTIYTPHYTQKLDYELEYACVLGKEGLNLDEDAAWDAIFGFTILNDFSARDIQFKEMTCRLGPAKGKDFATAIGPYIVTKDEIADVRNLTMTARVNGEQWSEGNSGTSHWTWAQMVAYASQEEAVYPTDVMGSGTVGGGCGYELDRWVQPGDVVELEVTGLGVLKNTIGGPRPSDESLKGQEASYVVSG
jgi:2-keto-4-pentenoate hydratase/2-oxohepta-3-ene-1,7-dioic acid hydratase in catechol pathway